MREEGRLDGHSGPLGTLAGSTDVFYAPFLMPVLPVVPLIGEQKGNRREPGGRAQTAGLPFSTSVSLACAPGEP